MVASAPSGVPTGRLVASPIVRRLARERGLDLSAITGTGPGGRIVRRDLDGLTASTPAPAPAAAPAAAPATAGAVGTPEKLSGMRKAIARRLTESKTTVPHFYVTAHCRVDRLLALRAQVNEAAPRKVSVNDFVLKAVAGALVEVPAANAIWGGDHILRFTGADIAVAVAVVGGLLTPVLRGVDAMSLVEVSATVAELAERARAGRLQQHELEGGSFSVSNLGMYGVDEFSAILNPPQSGILAVAAAKPQPVVEDGVLAVGTVMTVTLSADHRVVDGAVAAEWMAAFVRRIENPVTALL
jgi:pyruvate dehydrogenase E2 component (dihydrolipoamide acetyltransferase)